MSLEWDTTALCKKLTKQPPP